MINESNMCTNRTRLALCAFLALLFFVGTTGSAHAQFGVNAGLNFASADDIDVGDRSGTLENSTGYHVGVVYNMGFGPVDLRPAFVYRRVGEYELSASALPTGEATYDISAWEIPLDVKLTFPFPLVSPYVIAGPMATLPRGDDEFDDALEDVSYTLNVGVGGSMSLGSITLEPELRYEFGATGYIKDDFEVGDTEFSPSEAPRFNAFSLRLNVFL